jgi:hypothetical protein
MTYKPNDIVRWTGQNGILKKGQDYLVWQVKDGQFTLKYPDWWMVEPITWYTAGLPFVKRRAQG